MYKLSHNENIIIKSDGTSFDATSGGGIAQEYLRWRDGYTDNDGIEHPPHTPEPADPVIIPPVTVVSMRQARLQLLSMPFSEINLLEAVDSAITSMTKAAQVEWEYAAEVKRGNALFLEIAQSLGFTETQIDEFFNAANLL